MRNLKTYQDFLLEKTSGDVFDPKRGKRIQFNHTEHPELAKEFFDLITTAYSAIGGHAKIQKPEDIFADPDWDWWEGVDLHGTKDFDLIMFGSRTRYGVKFAGVGHDGSSQAKREYIQDRAKDLVQPGYYVEVSGRIAQILISDYGCPQVKSQDDVEKVLGKKIEWKGKCPDDPNMPGEGWYVRKIAGHPHSKILLGRPKGI